MEEKNYKKRHIGLTIWTWFLQFIVWISFFLYILNLYYENKYLYIKNKYPEYYDYHGVPYYISNWSENKMKKIGFPAFIIFIISYISYIITEFCSSTFRYLYHKKDDIKMYKKMEQLFCSHPIIIFKCSCYHYETTTVYYTDSNGNRQSRTETRRVNTHFDSFVMPYHSSRDISGKFVLDTAKEMIAKKDYVKLKLTLIIDLADAISNSDHDKYKSDFADRNRNYDIYMDVWEERTLPGFNPYNLVMINEKESCTIHIFWYILFIFLTFVQFYKWYIDSKCIHQSFKIVKLVSTRFNLLEQNEYTEKQPKLNLITKTYDFDLSKTGFCEEKKIDLPLQNEIEEAQKKYGNKVKNYNLIHDNEFELDLDDDNLNQNKTNEDYTKTITFHNESDKNDNKQS